MFQNLINSFNTALQLEDDLNTIINSTHENIVQRLDYWYLFAEKLIDNAPNKKQITNYQRMLDTAYCIIDDLNAKWWELLNAEKR